MHPYTLLFCPLQQQRKKKTQFPIWREGASNRGTSDKTNDSRVCYCYTSLFITTPTRVTRKRMGTYKLHIRTGINIVLLGGDKGIDTKVEGGVKILIVNSSLPWLGTKFHRIKTVKA